MLTAPSSDRFLCCLLKMSFFFSNIEFGLGGEGWNKLEFCTLDSFRCEKYRRWLDPGFSIFIRGLPVEQWRVMLDFFADLSPRLTVAHRAVLMAGKGGMVWSEGYCIGAIFFWKFG